MHVAPAADSSDLPAEPDRRTLKVGDYLAMSLFWFPINLFWSVMLLKFLPGRVEEMVGDLSKGTYLAYITAIGAVATTVIQLVVGPISDSCAAKWGRRHPFILWGTLGCALCNLAFVRVGSFPLLMLSFLGIQLFLNAATGPYQALIPDNVPRSRHGLASAYMGFALLFGQLGAGVALAVLDKVGMANILYFTTGFLLLGMIVTMTLVPDRPAYPDEQLPVAQSLAEVTRWNVRDNPDFYTLLGSRFCINLAYSTVTTFINFYLKDTIGPPSEANKHLSNVLLVVTVAGLLGTVAAGQFTDRVSKKFLIYLSCAILAVSAFVFCFTSHFMFVLIIAGVFGAGWGIFSAVDWAMACNLLPKGGAAKYMAIWHICMTVPQVLAPAFGPIADALNRSRGHGLGWRAAMLSTVIYLIGGALILRKVREQPATVEATVEATV